MIGPEADALAAAPGDPERTQARIWLSVKRITEASRDTGLRELREICDKGDTSACMIHIARAVLWREGGNPPAVPK
jgi:hypothetical protein